MENKITALDLLEIDSKQDNLKLRCIAGEKGLDKPIKSKSINRPGLALGGFFDFFSYDCIQVFGRGEYNFIEKFIDSAHFENIEKMLEYEIPCCLFSNNSVPSQNFIDKAQQTDTPILISELSTSELVSVLFNILSDTFALTEKMHGCLIEVFGLGVLLYGKTGIGKSETALELIERGHRLVADDTVNLKAIGNTILMGEGLDVVKHHMEIKGIGIINIKDLYGVRAIRDKKRIQLIVELEEWDSKKQYERLGIQEKYIELLNIKTPSLIIPVMPGRNIPIIIETAAMNQRLKMMGINSAKEFNKNLMEYYETEEIKNSYFL